MLFDERRQDEAAALDDLIESGGFGRFGQQRFELGGVAFGESGQVSGQEQHEEAPHDKLLDDEDEEQDRLWRQHV